MKTEDFPILKRQVHGKRLVYLDSAASSQRPQQVVDAIVKSMTEYNANVHRGIHTLSQEASTAYEEAHKKVADFIGAAEEEIIFTRNTTESMNMLALSLEDRISEGDEIVVSAMEHHSNFVPWQQLCKRKGAKFIVIPVNKNGELDNYEEYITDKAKIVALTHVSNTLGTINPIKEITQKVHSVGAIMIVDGAQSVPHMAVNVKDLNCDFFAFSSHKMCGPTGIGALYGKKELLEELEPPYTGGGMVSKVTVEESTWASIPWRFEAGTPAITEGVGFGAAVDYLSAIGMDAVAAYEDELTSYAIEQLSTVNKVNLLGPKKRAGIVSFTIEGMSCDDAGMLLDKDGIAVRCGYHCTQPLMDALGVGGTVRASFYIYNTKEDVDALVSSVKHMVEKYT